MKNIFPLCLLSFFSLFFQGFSSCAALDTGSYFYEGLKQNSEETRAEAIAFFEKSLETKNPYISSAALAELMELKFNGVEVSADTLGKIKKKSSGKAIVRTADFWEKTLDVLGSSSEIKDKALAALLNSGNRPADGAVHYLLRELNSKQSAPFTDAENAAVRGRMAVSRNSFREGLNFFRETIEASPELFFRYPDLINDLGRCFQYGSSDNEGLDLFLEWEANTELRKSIPHGSENLVSYRLLFFAGRIARQRGEPHIELFEKALLWALSLPDNIQSEQVDACIWYIQSTAESNGIDDAIHYLIKYIPQWRDDTYFFDIVDRLTRRLVLELNWDKIISLFPLFQNYSNALTARYAWIIARAIEEDFFSPEEIFRAVEALPEGGLSITDESLKIIIVNSFKKITYDKSIGGNIKFVGASGAASLYYRTLSAQSLNKPFLFKLDKNFQADKTNADGINFLNGFFEHDAGQFALKFIRMMEKDLSPSELYILAEGLNKTGQYLQSIRLVSLYAGKENFKARTQDLHLLYPRPYKDLVEKFAEESGIEPAILFALIRTESSFEADAKSRVGASGLTQLMPATAEEQAKRIQRDGGPDYHADGELDVNNPSVNIHIGSSYLAHLNERMGDLNLALLAYNGGMGRVRRWLESARKTMPFDLFLETVEFPETRNYGKSVLAAAAMYRELYYKN